MPFNTSHVPHFLAFNARRSLLEETIADLASHQNDEKTLKQVNEKSKAVVKSLKANSLENLIVKIVGTLLTFFKCQSNFVKYQNSYQELTQLVYNHSYYYKKIVPSGNKTSLKEIIGTHKGISDTPKLLLKKELAQYNQKCIQTFYQTLKQDEIKPEKIFDEYKKLTPQIKKYLIACICTAYGRPLRDIAFAHELIKRNPRALLSIINSKQESLPQQLEQFFSKKAEVLSDLITLQLLLESKFNGHFKENSKLSSGTEQILKNKGFNFSLKSESNSKILKTVVQEIKENSGKNFVDVFPRLISLKREKTNPQPFKQTFINPAKLDKPINVTMVGVECTHIIKQGGLGEAIFGMAQGILNQKNDGHQHKVRIILPKYDILPENIQKQLKEKPKYAILTGQDHKVCKVYKATVEGIRFYFIEDGGANDKFALKNKLPNNDKGKLNNPASKPEDPSVYGSNLESVCDRFAFFSSLAADLIVKMKEKTDVIHLHDWHVAGTAIKLEKEYKEQWQKGQIPPVVFTFHNNQSGSGIYDYNGVSESLRDLGYTGNAADLFSDVIKRADVVTTVSESFASESQQDPLDKDEIKYAGVKAIRQAAVENKFVGILNGSNPTLWNPETDKQLKNWIDPISKVPVNLTYSPKDNVVAKKEIIREQLSKWLSIYRPNVKLDLTKPIVTFCGRYDSSQKGLDLFETAIKETLAQGGQIIFMGSQEDEKAKVILDKLEKKYKDGVFFIRDIKIGTGWAIQNGTKDQPGIGSIVRAATDFLLVPSNYEPCGLVQFESWIFGGLVIGTETGGLKDTIKPLSSPKFNGFLFNRDLDKSLTDHKNALKTSINDAFTYWKSSSTETKNSVMKRLIEDGRQYSWTTAAEGMSPIDKYLAVYKMAQDRLILRNPDLKHFDIFQIAAVQSNQKHKQMRWLNRYWISLMKSYKSLRFCQFPFANRKVFKMQAKYYEKMLDEKNSDIFVLNRAYQNLPSDIRQYVQAPYASQGCGTAYTTLGAHLEQGGANFKVHAPNAKTLVLLLTGKSGSTTEVPMQKQKNGNWQTFVPNIKAGQKYQYIINGVTKLDPYGIGLERSEDPKKSPYSVVSDPSYKWEDQKWIDERRQNSKTAKPMNIYEVFPTRWKRKDGNAINYRDLAIELATYSKQMGYTHVELMGIMEHHNEDSWGYRVTNYFAPNSRLGSVEDFKFMVDYLHSQKIGIILDWVPAHFAKDSYGLGNFDGSRLYEPSFWHTLTSVREYAFRWKTYFFDFKSKATRELLLSSALYWTKEMHIDGLRVDAVKSMFWSDDAEAGRVFLRDLNSVVHGEDSSVLTIAEDYTGDPSTIAPTNVKGGLGFDMQWNIGWMHHTTNYFQKSPQKRQKYYKEILRAAFSSSENPGIRGISHDEVNAQNKKQSLLKITPDLKESEKFANQRLLLSFLSCLPGDHLTFMGTEFGASEEWDKLIPKDSKKDTGASIDWNQSKNEPHKGLQSMVETLNQFCNGHSAFWKKTNGERHMDWIEENDPQKSLIAYHVSDSNGEQFACLHNFSPNECRVYEIPFNDPIVENLKEVFNSDDEKFGGEGQVNKKFHLVKNNQGKLVGYKVIVPPLATVIIQETKAKSKKSVNFQNKGSIEMSLKG